MSRAAVPRQMARRVRIRARNCCEYCLLPQQWQESTFHIDHLRPRSARGKNQLDNLALACVGCSLKKGRRSKALDPASQQSVRLFNPRLDRWGEHFACDGHWRIVGLTAVGRATAAALEFNRDRLVEIRRELASVGRYPPV